MTGTWLTLAYIVIAGFVATDFWRYLGVFTALRINEGSEVFQWVRAVSTALVAALIARLIFFPPGALADTPLTLRLVAFAVGVGVYLWLKRAMLLGILAGVTVLIGGLLLGLGG